MFTEGHGKSADERVANARESQGGVVTGVEGVAEEIANGYVDAGVAVAIPPRLET